MNRVRPHHVGLAPICGFCRQRLAAPHGEAVTSLMFKHPEHSARISWLFAASFTTFILGLFSPLMTVSKHVEKWFITLVDEKNTVSLAAGIIDLALEDHWGLFAILLLFSVIFPVTKLLLCLAMWLLPMPSKRRAHISKLLYHSGKWSMLDVFVIGILVVVVKLGDVVEVEVHSGVFWFAGSVCFTIWLKSALSKIDAPHS
jgi:paraquat-inducible protein A